MPRNTLSNDQLTTLYGYFEANRRVLTASEEMPVTILSTFLGVAMWEHEGRTEEPLSLMELGEKVGLPASTVSRHLRYLGYGPRRKVPGMEVVRTYVHPENRRMKYAVLTAKGRALRDGILFALRNDS